eukprot:GHVR01092714.1.p1 GENE.GHVR01092714.1~~GHVR01092714.1.p1  ORF type:complete len:120 (+),score=32.48 GHVR01092714.1:77-436(+)
MVPNANTNINTKYSDNNNNNNNENNKLKVSGVHETDALINTNILNNTSKIFLLMLTFLIIVCLWGLLDAIILLVAKNNTALQCVIYASILSLSVLLLAIFKLFNKKFDMTKHFLDGGIL